MVFADEWAGHIGAMGRYAAGRDAASADRGFFNTAFDGGPFAANRANRKGGDRIAVANLQITVIGGVQPEGQGRRGHGAEPDRQVPRGRRPRGGSGKVLRVLLRGRCKKFRIPSF
jgi:hypothetical protein